MSVLSDLACLLPTQCGKLANFPSFIFYVKSILTDKKGAKNVILTVLEALNFDFVEIAQLKMSKKFPKIQKTVELVKMVGF